MGGGQGTGDLVAWSWGVLMVPFGEQRCGEMWRVGGGAGVGDERANDARNCG